MTDVPFIASPRFRGTVWRGHRTRFDALNFGGTQLRSGRFHRAPDRWSPIDSWPALYTSLDLATAVGEMVRTRKPGDLRDVRITEITVVLQTVADCRDLTALRVDRVRLFDDWDYSTGHALALAVRRAGAEGMLVPSASGLGDNLVLFPDLLRADSDLTAVRSIDPNRTKDDEWPI